MKPYSLDELGTRESMYRCFHFKTTFQFERFVDALSIGDHSGTFIIHYPTLSRSNRSFHSLGVTLRGESEELCNSFTVPSSVYRILLRDVKWSPAKMRRLNGNSL